MGFIYLIENDINDKKYVGLTSRNIEIRWKEHLRSNSQKIDKAIQVLGKEHFSIKVLEECEDALLDEREIYWINYYDSYNNGYNFTLGGREENMIFSCDDFSKTKELWDLGFGQKEIQQQLKINIETVHNYLLKNGITADDIKERHREKVGKSKSKKIIQLDLNDNIIKIWDSIISIDREGVASRAVVGRCLKGQQKTGKGFKWKYYTESEDIK